jgi:putative ABC transport system permease protein
MGPFFEDLKYAVRLQARTWGVTVVALCTLTLGIGASTTVISVLNTILLKPLPYPQPERIVIPWRLALKEANLGYSEIPWGDVAFLHLQTLRSFQSLGAFKSRTFNLTGLGEPVQLQGLKVSKGFFPSLGVMPYFGRFFNDEEDRPENGRAVILSHEIWRERFHSDRGILGRDIVLNGVPCNVVGVMPAGFAFPHAEEMPGNFDFPRQAQLWLPLGLPLTDKPFEADELAVIARLKPAVPVAQAQAEMNLFSVAMERQFPESKGWFRSRVTGLKAQATGDIREPLLLVLCAVGGLLLIACANVANLLLVRSLDRRGEFALRSALGADKLRLGRQFFTESALLSLGGGATAAIFAAAALHLLKIFGPANIPRLQEVALDWRSFIFAFGVSLFSGVLFGLLPIAGVLRDNLAEPLHEIRRGGGHRFTISRLRNAFLVAQIALALILVVASGLLVRTFFRVLAVDPGFKAEHVLTFELSLPFIPYSDLDHITRFYQKLLADLAATSGVAHAGIVETLPLTGAPDGTVIHIVGRPNPPGKEPFANYSVVSPDYFSAMRTPLLRGRAFRDSDTTSSRPVIIVNAAMAQMYWPREDPIGKQISLGVSQPQMTITGVVADIKHLSLREHPEPEIFVPFMQKPFSSMRAMHVVLRGEGDAILLSGRARDAIRHLDPDLPIYKMQTLNTVIDDSLASQRFSMLLLGAFSILSLALASIGLYGVVSYSTSQRTREIGVRMALGAHPTAVFAMVFGQATRLVTLGMLLGLVAAFGITRFMASTLYGVQPTDAIAFLAAVPVLAIAALTACYAPAHRATQVDPIAALRHE